MYLFALQSISLLIQQETVFPELKVPFLSLADANFFESEIVHFLKSLFQ